MFIISMGRCGEGWVEVWNRRSEERVEEGGDGMILPLVVFGHDAKRGFFYWIHIFFLFLDLQFTSRAIGLDTGFKPIFQAHSISFNLYLFDVLGCVYGRMLSGVILPSREIVNVQALVEYSQS